MKMFIRLVIVNAAMVICFVIANLLPGLWTGMGGRDFRPQAFNAAFLILAASIAMRYKFKWPISHMIICLIPTQLIVLISVSYFSGYSLFQLLGSFDLFYDFLQWLLFVDLYIGVPWIIGVFIGSLILKMKKKDKKTGHHAVQSDAGTSRR